MSSYGNKMLPLRDTPTLSLVCTSAWSISRGFMMLGCIQNWTSFILWTQTHTCSYGPASFGICHFILKPMPKGVAWHLGKSNVHVCCNKYGHSRGGQEPTFLEKQFVCCSWCSRPLAIKAVFENTFLNCRCMEAAANPPGFIKKVSACLFCQFQCWRWGGQLIASLINPPAGAGEDS